MIRKEVYLNDCVVEEFKKMVKDSEILECDDFKWPEPVDAQEGSQELEIVMNNVHLSFLTTKIGSMMSIQKSDDPEGLSVFYYLVQDVKTLVLSLINLHFKIKPI
eukprot:TRINITY_DN370_c1_g1_i5.p1 TRINITY_DN370_c1_g1~~TRINITY_DN370_c1_g1_i5.p1  ORF type:complete len:105 (+),score=43.67 TRINITY_DN370_c1_g1_i5:293-607(+)